MCSKTAVNAAIIYNHYKTLTFIVKDAYWSPRPLVTFQTALNFCCYYILFCCYFIYIYIAVILYMYIYTAICYIYISTALCSDIANCKGRCTLDAKP